TGLNGGSNASCSATQAGGIVHKSSDGGANWTPGKTGLGFNNPSHALLVSPSYTSDHTLTIGANYGIYRSSDSGDSWAQVLSTYNVTSLAASPAYATDHTLFAGAYLSGFYKSTDSGINWVQSNTGLGNTMVFSLAVSPAFVTDQTIFAGLYGKGVYKSTDSGATWSSVNTGIDTLHANSLAISPAFATDQTIYVATSDNHLYQSFNAGVSWHLADSGISGTISSIAISPAFVSDQTLFAATSNGTFKTTDSGNSWTRVHTASSSNPVISPAYATDHTVLFTVYGGNVYRSSDGGSSWSPSNSAFDVGRKQLTTLAISPAFASDHTVFTSTYLAGPYIISGGPVSFGSIQTGTTSASRQLTITNGYGMFGDANLAISSISLSGTNAPLFSVSPGSCGSLTPVIVPGASCSVDITFAPDTVSSKSAALQIANNDPQSPTQSITLSGTGVMVSSSITTPTSGTFTNATSVVATGTATCNGCTVSLVEVSADGGATWQSASGTTSWSASVPVTIADSYTIRSRATTSTGIVETAGMGITINVERTPPATSILPTGGTYSSAQSATLTCNDVGSGCSAIYYCLGTGCTPSLPYSDTISVNASTDLRYYSTDIAGNSETIQTATYTISPLPGDLVTSGDLYGGISMNSLGEIVWGQNLYDQGSWSTQLYSSLRGQITNPPGSLETPAINSLGDMVWVENGNTLRGTIGGQTVTLATTPFWFNGVDINNRGEVVWSQCDGNSNCQIFSSVRGPLTANDARYNLPHINNRGDIVYSKLDQAAQSTNQIYKLETGSLTPVKVMDSSNNQWYPAINDSGEIVWNEIDVSGPLLVNRLVSSVRGTLLTTGNELGAMDLNDCGDIAYSVLLHSGQKPQLYRLGNSAPCASSTVAHTTQAQAAPVALGDIFTGVADGTANPVEWYRFEAVAADTLQILVNYDRTPPNTLTIGLYDSQGTLLSGPTATNPLGIKMRAGYTDSYYLKIEAAGGRFGYSVSLSKYSYNCGVGPCPEMVTSGNLYGGISMNSLGEIVWGLNLYDQGNWSTQIYSSLRGQLTSPPTTYSDPAINSLGDVVWVENGNTLRGTIGGQTVTLATTPFWFHGADINDRGEVVWSQCDSSNRCQIISSVLGPLTGNDTDYNSPHINNRGDIVYSKFDQSAQPSMQVYKLGTGSLTPVKVANSSSNQWSPAINDSGEIVWNEGDASGPLWVNRLVSSVRGTLLTTNNGVMGVDLNNCGDVAYSVSLPSGQQQLYRLDNNVPCASLTVAKQSAGSGNGRITSTPAGIALQPSDSTATATFSSNITVTLTATPDNGSVFAGWSGDCSGSGSCSVTMSQARSVTATFTYALPGAPTGVTAAAGNGQATVSFTAPASNGGSAITGYTVISAPGGITASGAASPIIVTGLTNGTAYTFTVTATNGNGTGTASSPSNYITPFSLTSTITSPATGFYTNDTSVALSGTATCNGCTVSLVEVSSDNGFTWQAATGTTSWSASIPLPTAKSYTIKSRATTSEGLIETPYSGITVNVYRTPPTASLALYFGLWVLDARDSMSYCFERSYPSICGQLEMSFNGSNWQPATTYVMTGSPLWLRDRAGNTAYISGGSVANNIGGPLKIDGGSYYSFLQHALNAAGSGNTIRLAATALSENLTLSNSAALTIKGGYDSNLSSITGITPLNGNLTVQSGSLTLENVGLTGTMTVGSGSVTVTYLTIK
ncbi:MAG: choice-of-anchor D domain-containing protein, partial [Geobacter sp.]|nr:choice-of-anchor D domain-containing protein [Geobacter sp.]